MTKEECAKINELNAYKNALELANHHLSGKLITVGQSAADKKAGAWTVRVIDLKEILE